MRLPYATRTKLAEIKAKEHLQHSMRLFAQIRKEGGYIGDTPKAAGPRLDAYWASITNPDGSINFHDMALIIDPGTEVKIRNGLEPDGPQSPVWINYLRIPGLFTEHAKDFVRLNAQQADRYQGAQP